MTYTVSAKNYVGENAVIVTHDAATGHEIPVLHLLPGETSFPGDTKKLAENIASILNAKEPLHKMDLGTTPRLYWSANGNGVALRLQENAISVPALLLYTNDTALRDTLQRSSFMEYVCRSLQPRGAGPASGPRPEQPHI